MSKKQEPLLVFLLQNVIISLLTWAVYKAFDAIGDNWGKVTTLATDVSTSSAMAGTHWQHAWGGIVSTLGRKITEHPEATVIVIFLVALLISIQRGSYWPLGDLLCASLAYFINGVTNPQGVIGFAHDVSASGGMKETHWQQIWESMASVFTRHDWLVTLLALFVMVLLIRSTK